MDHLLNDPKLLPFLPMLYVAWSDGDLSREEAAVLCSRLGDDCAALLGPWLTPEKAPDARQLQRLLAHLRGKARELPVF